MGLWDVQSVVVTVEDGGALAVDAQGTLLPARLADPATSVQPGQALRLLLPSVQDGMWLWGCVVALEQPGNAPQAALAPGTCFRMSVLRLTGVTEPDVRPVPEQDRFPDDDESTPPAVLGNLRHMPLGDVLQALESGHRTACIEVHPRTGEYGTITVHGGRVMDARWMALHGLDAVLALLGVERGTFWIRYVTAPAEAALDLSISWILMEAMRRTDGARGSVPTTETRCLWHFSSLEIAGTGKGEDPWRRNSSTPGCEFPWNDSGSVPRG